VSRAPAREAKRPASEPDVAKEKTRELPPAEAPAAAGGAGAPAPLAAAKPSTPPAPLTAPAPATPVQEEAPAERRSDAAPPAPAPARSETLGKSTEPPPPPDAAARDARAAQPAPPPAVVAPPVPPAPGARGGMAGAAPGPPPSAGQSSAAAKAPMARRLMRAVDASGRLVVSAREPAETALDALLGRLGGRRVERRLEGDRGLLIIDVLVPGARYRELIEGLGQIGRWVTEYEPGTLPAQLRVEVAVTVEP
jgi:hypothetical protein